MKRILMVLAGVLAAGLAQGQSWPPKPGGGSGQPFVVENRAGGDGYIGFEAVARAEPDGYTLVYSPGSSMMIAPHIVKRPDLDPTRVLTPVVATGGVSLYVLVHPKMPAGNFAEFMAHVRANP